MTELLLTILFGTLIITGFKVLHLLKMDVLQVITVNYLVAVAFGFSVWREPFSLAIWSAKPWFEISIIIGVFFILTYFLFARSSEKAGLAITAVASKMSVVIPVMAGFLIFGDHVSLQKVAGILLTLAAFYMIFLPKHGLKIDYRFVLLPFLLLLGNGMNDVLVKYSEQFYLNHDEGLFLSFIFFVALLIGAVVLFFKQFLRGRFITLKNLLGGLILGSLNYWGAYFFLIAMEKFQASFLFPVVNVGIVGLSAISGYLIFKEKLSRINWIGIFMAIIAITLVSMG
jgi:drug/metabolite transporter (DMT)-like permease